ncbi:peptidase domain-containing ABC transporter [Nisaea sediminum]|uniref:peptidase domain-containing ABC transporter n=1 Tax=Nisaea sediminum TaxID=2775867 RepID=UPI0018672CC4|nr:type I secretion system permease/ATPase [Nisaea sediminum]
MTGSGAATAGAERGGIRSLAALFALIGFPVPAHRLRHELGMPEEQATAEDLLAVARHFECAAAVRTMPAGKLVSARLPAIAELKRGDNLSFVLVGRASADKVLLTDPESGKPATWDLGEFERLYSGRLIEISPPRTQEADERRPFGLSWFLPILLKYKHLVAEVAIASFLLQIFALSTPLFFMLIMDKVLSTGALTTLDILAIGLLAVGIFEFVMGVLRGRLMSFATHRIDVELAGRFFRHLSTLPASFFASRQTGRTTQRAQELQQIRSFLTGSAPTAIIDLLFSIVFLGVIAYFAPFLALVVGIGMVLIFAVYGVITPVLKKRLMSRATGMTENQGFLVETVFGMETVKSLAVEPALQRSWERQMADQTVWGEKSEKLTQNANQLVTLINRVAVVVTLYLGARFVIDGSISAGQLVAVNMMTMRALAPAQRVAQMWNQLQQVLLAVSRLGEVMNAVPEPKTTSSAALPDIRGRVEFRGVSFRYGEDSPEVLEDVSFTIQPGEVVAVVGPSGSGKSTIAKLLQRLYWPQKGKILVDGVDLALVDPAWLRRQVAHVLQDPFLFNRSIRDNIAVADPTMPMEQVMEAAKLTGAHDFILSLPNAYDTVIGERGAKLSGGERQRIVLARALATNPRILILDEATSALDFEAERLIQERMGEICAGRTVIVITHRLSSVRRFRHILVVEDGKITEKGGHEELRTREGWYARMDALQNRQNEERQGAA